MMGFAILFCDLEGFVRESAQLQILTVDYVRGPGVLERQRGVQADKAGVERKRGGWGGTRMSFSEITTCKSDLSVEFKLVL